MKTRMKSTSLEANNTVDKPTQKKVILDCIRKVGTITAKGVVWHTKIKINAVSGRINDLLHDQQIKENGKIVDVVGGVPVTKYAIRKETDPLNVFEPSKDEQLAETKTKLSKLKITHHLVMKYISEKYPDDKFIIDVLINHEL